MEPWHLRRGYHSPAIHSLRTKEGKIPPPVQGHETLISAQGLDVQQAGSREESAAVMAQDGWQEAEAGGHFVLVASQEADLGCGFSSRAERLPFAFKGQIQLARTRTPGESGKGLLESDRLLDSKSAPLLTIWVTLDLSPNLCFLICN